MTGFLALTLTGLWDSAKAALQNEQQPLQSKAKPLRPWRSLQSTTYRATDGPHQLTLSEKELPDFEELDFGLALTYAQSHPDHPTPPNTVFALTDSVVGSSTEHLLWVQYAYHDKAIFPHQHWFANLVWPSDEAQPYVVLTMSIATHVEASVYKVPLKADLGPPAQEFDFSQFEKWPEASASFSKVNIFSIVYGRDIGATGIIKMDAVTDQDGIFLRGARENATEPPFFIRFNPKSGQLRKGLKPDALQGLEKLDRLG